MLYHIQMLNNKKKIFLYDIFHGKYPIVQKSELDLFSSRIEMMHFVSVFFCLINLINVNKGFVLQHGKQKNTNYLEDHLESNLYEDVDIASNELGKTTNLIQLVE